MATFAVKNFIAFKAILRIHRKTNFLFARQNTNCIKTKVDFISVIK